MGSAISNVSMTVKVTEQITLGGKDYGGTRTVAVASVNEVMSRVVNVLQSSGWVEVLSYGATTEKGQSITSEGKYIRITNLSTSFDLALKTKATAECSVFTVKPGHSFIISAIENGMDSSTADITWTQSPSAVTDISRADITNVYLCVLTSTGTDSIDVEVFAVS